MQICRNGPLDRFMRFLFTHSSIQCIVTYGTTKICGTNLCDLCLTRIIRIDKSLYHKFVALWYILCI